MTAEQLATTIHGDLEVALGRSMSEEQVVRLLHRLQKIGDPQSYRIPRYVVYSTAWTMIKEFIEGPE